jgi:hypothetical protein
MSALLISWIKSTTNGHEETIKWSHGNTKYETHSPVLEDLELKVLMPHCLAVKTKIEQVVTIDARTSLDILSVRPRDDGRMVGQSARPRRDG